MTLLDTAMSITHLLVGALWVGAVVFVAGVVLPAARDGDLNAEPTERVVDSLTTWSRAGAVLTFVTGGHLAGSRYGLTELAGTFRGQLVLTMLGLWVALAGLVEVGSSKTRAGLKERRVRAPAREGLPWFRAAALAGFALLLVAGLLT
jgi:uncharacterized membrane protein